MARARPDPVPLGRLEEAEKAFRTAVTLNPDDWTARNGLGATLLRLNRLDEAISEFERMQALVPDNTRAYNNLGSAFLLQERFDKRTRVTSGPCLSTSPPGTRTSARRSTSRAVRRRGAHIRRRRDPARRGVPALVQPRRRLLLGGLPHPGEGGVRDRPEAGRADTTSGRPELGLLAELAASHAVLALLTRGSEQQEHRNGALKLLALVGPLARDARVLSTIATTYEELGDRPKALEWLAQAIKAGQSVKSLERSPWLKDLRGDERYQRLRQ